MIKFIIILIVGYLIFGILIDFWLALVNISQFGTRTYIIDLGSNLCNYLRTGVFADQYHNSLISFFLVLLNFDLSFVHQINRNHFFNEKQHIFDILFTQMILRNDISPEFQRLTQQMVKIIVFRLFTFRSEFILFAFEILRTESVNALLKCVRTPFLRSGCILQLQF
ncbi:Hypothetical_protein [Hexamita inflata]|uniref:Hypothetical_protein n=1 Tax=Hexamita inflata TaxID=28002 RepID=A0AA86R5A7_9EUKA|nr:Hypothetical protein HINF_LOCUS59406 [Hexamita inflata]